MFEMRLFWTLSNRWSLRQRQHKIKKHIQATQ